MRMELHACKERLTKARREIAQVYDALFGDVHWNERCFAVYELLRRDQAPWDPAKPLGTWLASLRSHIHFLGKLADAPSVSELPFRIASLRDVHAFFAAEVRGTFYLELE